MTPIKQCDKQTYNRLSLGVIGWIWWRRHAGPRLFVAVTLSVCLSLCLSVPCQQLNRFLSTLCCADVRRIYATNVNMCDVTMCAQTTQRTPSTFACSNNRNKSSAISVISGTKKNHLIFISNTCCCARCIKAENQLLSFSKDNQSKPVVADGVIVWGIITSVVHVRDHQRKMQHGKSQKN